MPSPCTTRPLMLYGPAEQPAGVVEIARRQRITHRAARDALAVERDAGHGFDLETETGRRLLQHHEIAGTPRAEAEIIAHLQPAHAQSPDQRALDEVLGGMLRKFVIETAYDCALDAMRRNQFELLAQRRQPGRRLVGRKKFARMRLERHHARRDPVAHGGLAQLRQHGLVAEMNAVEIADGQRDGGVRSDRDAARNAHAATKLKSLNCSVF